MILKREVENIALQKEISRSTIDKDWVLGHFIDAIYNILELRTTLIFKGGTCLKKCWLPDYRFSEDLDFTSLSQEFKLTEGHLNLITSFVENNAGIPVSVASLKPLRFNNKLTGYEAIIKFWGADHPRNTVPPSPDKWQTKIKIEIILYEHLVFDTVQRSVNHPYSDSLSLNMDTIPCYAMEEVLAEKMRALIQRSYAAPRDFYDIWYLSKHFASLDYKEIIAAFHKKMAFKGHTFTGIKQLINPENDKQLSAAWKNSLAHQITGGLPDYEIVKNELETLFNKIFFH